MRGIAAASPALPAHLDLCGAYPADAREARALDVAVAGMPEAEAALAARGVCSREDLAEQSTEDLDGVGGLTEATAGKLIMAARAHWFTDGASA